MCSDVSEERSISIFEQKSKTFDRKLLLCLRLLSWLPLSADEVTIPSEMSAKLLSARPRSTNLLGHRVRISNITKMSVIQAVFCARQNEGNPRTSKEIPPETLTSEKIVLPVDQPGFEREGGGGTEMAASLVYGVLHLTVFDSCLKGISRRLSYFLHLSGNAQAQQVTSASFAFIATLRMWQ
jgi:hypothetical protein